MKHRCKRIIDGKNLAKMYRQKFGEMDPANEWIQQRPMQSPPREQQQEGDVTFGRKDR